MAQAAEGTILKFSPDGTKSTFVSGLDQPGGVAFDRTGNLFVSVGPGQFRDITKITPGGEMTVFATVLSIPSGLAFDGPGNLYVGGNALANNAVLIRAIGPSLTQAGVTNPLLDPTLELHNSTGAIVATNDDWQETQEDQITASGLAPTDPDESAIFATLPAGNYTAVVRGADDTTGVALVEVYSVSQ